jgi:hypothetical protein
MPVEHRQGEKHGKKRTHPKPQGTKRQQEQPDE